MAERRDQRLAPMIDPGHSSETMAALTIPVLHENRLGEYVTPRDSTPALIAELDQALAVHDAWLSEIEELYEQASRLEDDGKDAGGVVELLWEAACERLREYLGFIAQARRVGPRSFRYHFLHGVGQRTERLAELMRTMAVVWSELDLCTHDDIEEAVWTVRISPAAYLRAMWNLFWSSVRHPLSDTVIELKSGRVLAD